MIVRLTQLDGKLPNLALMRLARHHRHRGDEVHFTRALERGLFEPEYDRVYGSAIFAFSSERVARLRRAFPDAIVGGTGSGSNVQIEDIEPGAPDALDYTDYPDFLPSIGFTQRGCRLSCKFCVVPTKEGRPRSVNTISDIWRGPGHPKQLHLLDNDFFGQPAEDWRARLHEIRDGGFVVCFSQGLNIRKIDDEAAAELATVEYRDDQFERRRLYTAWDNHAGARPVKAGEIADILARIEAEETSLVPELARELLNRVHRTAWPLSSVLGTAIMGTPVPALEWVRGRYGDHFDSDRIDHHKFAWPLTDIERFEPPIPARGVQGFWSWSP